MANKTQNPVTTQNLKKKKKKKRNIVSETSSSVNEPLYSMNITSFSVTRIGNSVSVTRYIVAETSYFLSVDR